MKSRRLKLLLLSTVVAGACHPALGCSESDFDLASSSRLPKVLAPRDGSRHDAVSARLSYHLGLWLGEGRGVTRLWLVGKAGIAVKEVICEGWEHTRAALELKVRRYIRASVSSIAMGYRRGRAPADGADLLHVRR